MAGGTRVPVMHSEASDDIEREVLLRLLPSLGFVPDLTVVERQDLPGVKVTPGRKLPDFLVASEVRSLVVEFKRITPFEPATVAKVMRLYFKPLVECLRIAGCIWRHDVLLVPHGGRLMKVCRDVRHRSPKLVDALRRALGTASTAGYAAMDEYGVTLFMHTDCPFRDPVTCRRRRHPSSIWAGYQDFLCESRVKAEDAQQDGVLVCLLHDHAQFYKFRSEWHIEAQALAVNSGLGRIQRVLMVAGGSPALLAEVWPGQVESTVCLPVSLARWEVYFLEDAVRKLAVTAT